MIGDGIVGSLAVTIFACGKKRLAFPNTEFFIHQCGYDCADGERITGNLAQLKALICREQNNQKGADFWQQTSTVCNIMDKITVEIISSQTSMPSDLVGFFLEKEKIFSAEEAMKCGLVHDIVYPGEVAIVPEFGVYQPW